MALEVQREFLAGELSEGSVFDCSMLQSGCPAAAIWHLQNPVEVSTGCCILMEVVKHRAACEERSSG